MDESKEHVMTVLGAAKAEPEKETLGEDEGDLTEAEFSAAKDLKFAMGPKMSDEAFALALVKVIREVVQGL